MTPTNAELISMANEFDEFAMEFCEQNLMSPLAMSGVFLARMTKMAKDFGYPNEYTQLLTEIVKLHELTQAIDSNNSDFLH